VAAKRQGKKKLTKVLNSVLLRGQSRRRRKDFRGFITTNKQTNKRQPWSAVATTLEADPDSATFEEKEGETGITSGVVKVEGEDTPVSQQGCPSGVSRHLRSLQGGQGESDVGDPQSWVRPLSSWLALKETPGPY